MPMATKLGRMITYLYGLISIKAHGLLIMCSRENQVTNWNDHISNTTVPMVTKIFKMVTYFKWLPPIKLLNPLGSFF